MNSNLRGLITTIAIGQFIPVLLYPPASLLSASPIILGFAILIFVFVGYNLLQYRQWAKTVTVFMQGFNVIIRIMLLLAHGANPIKTGGGLNWDVIVFNVVAIAISVVIMYQFDTSQIELVYTR